MISQHELKELMDYSPDTGIFTWKYPKSRFVKTGDIAGVQHSNGYIYIKINGKMYFAHRLAWLYVYGVNPDYIDHINSIKNDNRIENIRNSTKANNNWNVGLRKDNKSGIKGVYWSEKFKKWCAKISTNGYRKQLGYFDRIEDAEQAIKTEREQQHGQYANHG